MTTADIKKIVDDKHAEQLTARLCRHWEVATERLEVLVQDMENGMDTCIEAEIYAAMMRMQSSMIALMELRKLPCAMLFSEYLERAVKTISNASIRQSVIAIAGHLLGEQQESLQASFFDMVVELLAQHDAMPAAQQEAIRQKVSPMEYFFGICAQHLKPEDLMMVASIIQKLKTEDDNQEEVTKRVSDMRQAMDDLSRQMSENLQMMLIWIILLMLLPSIFVNMLQQSRKNSQIFN